VRIFRQIWCEEFAGWSRGSDDPGVLLLGTLMGGNSFSGNLFGDEYFSGCWTRPAQYIRLH